MKIMTARFVKGAKSRAGYPALGIPEFAFFGRSNAGKSSLINMIVNRKGLVKTGSLPGMTREINFFAVNEAFCLADLPGYGFARRSRAETEAFDRMLAEYAETRRELRAVFFLVDLRREPGDPERDTVAYFESKGIEVIVVGTKADKLGANDRRAAARDLAAFFGRGAEGVRISSATKRVGREELLKDITARLVRDGRGGSDTASPEPLAPRD
ncbi:MAG TPA: ribosome biogenesis GTP-binding protein YihA/YsxC [Treponemataceae bacterium]|nr:ribosome biogenesis GTP-binding protein YihA/YsxC [Treponemataceae bacterium]